MYWENKFWGKRRDRKIMERLKKTGKGGIEKRE